MKKRLLTLFFLLSVAGQSSANTREPWLDKDDEFPVSCEPTKEMTTEECMNILRRNDAERASRQAQYDVLPMHEKIFRWVIGIAVFFIGIPWLLSRLFPSSSGNKGKS